MQSDRAGSSRSVPPDQGSCHYLIFPRYAVFAMGFAEYISSYGNGAAFGHPTPKNIIAWGGALGMCWGNSLNIQMIRCSKNLFRYVSTKRWHRQFGNIRKDISFSGVSGNMQ